LAHAAAQQQLATSPGLSNDAAGSPSPVSEATKLQNTAEISRWPGAPREPCALLNRTQVDTAMLQAGQELDRARAAIAQQENAIELLQAERLVLHEELELALARPTCRRYLFAAASVMTDPMRLADRRFRRRRALSSRQLDCKGAPAAGGRTDS
jgi:hypothetical protein